MTERICIYARESSADTNKAPSIDKQIQIGKDWIASQGSLCVEVFADKGYSGGNWNRPEWQRCVRQARANTFKVIWVFAQDRIARDTEQFLWFYRQVREKNIQIYDHTLRNYIDMETLGGRMMQTQLAASSEIFRLITSEKVKRAYEQNKRLNKPWGRRREDINEEVLVRLHTNLTGWRSITKAYNEEMKTNISYSTIRRVLLTFHK